MRAGRLNQKITIEQVTESRTGSGAVQETWNAFATVWASVEPLNGREYFQAQQETATVTTRIRIRYLAGVTPKMRVNYDNRIFDIESVIDVNERHRELVLMCKERV